MNDSRSSVKNGVSTTDHYSQSTPVACMMMCPYCNVKVGHSMSYVKYQTQLDMAWVDWPWHIKIRVITAIPWPFSQRRAGAKPTKMTPMDGLNTENDQFLWVYWYPLLDPCPLVRLGGLPGSVEQLRSRNSSVALASPAAEKGFGLHPGNSKVS